MSKFFRGIAVAMLALLLQFTFFANNATYAEEASVSITEMNIKVMPEFINPPQWEYELPALLVGLHGTFTNNSDTEYDGILQVTVPTHLPHFQSGFVAKFKDPEDRNPTEVEYIVDKDKQTLSWLPTEPIKPNEDYYFVVEYYTGSITGLSEREFEYEYVAESDIKDLKIAFYLPFRAENFKLDKEADKVSESFGLSYQIFEYTDVKKGDKFDYLATYLKDDIVTTMEAFDDMRAPDDEIHAGLNNGNKQDSEPLISIETAVFILIAVVLVAVFVFIVIRNKKGKPATTKVTEAPKKIVNKEEEIKKLRKMLADGQIDEKTYKEKRAKL